MSAAITIDQPEIARAESMREIAEHVHPVLAQAYRRRAAELTLGAWVRALREAPVEIDEFTPSARAVRAAA